MDDAVSPFDLSGAAPAAPADVDVSKLEYSYVAACTNARELYDLLRVLQSGQHGGA
jgi:hypothetical protein